MRRAVSLSAIVLLVLGCTESESGPASPGAPSLAQGGGAGPKINSADPSWTTQDTTLDVRVLGSGFDNGSRADWAIDGVTNPSNVRTNSTHYVSNSELVANITVSGTAPTVSYDIVVTTLLGKKGIGAEKFSVYPKGSGGPNGWQQVAVTMLSAGTGLVDDGKGVYQQGVCGVIANWTDIAIGMFPTGGSIPSSQTAACTGVAPRAATLRLAVKHLSDSPHLDDSALAGAGTFALDNVKFDLTGLMVVNAPPACHKIGRNGKLTGRALRFDPVNAAGSNAVIVEDLGGGLWHLFSAPYPNNLAYCEDNSGVSFWHVNVDLMVQALSQ